MMHHDALRSAAAWSCTHQIMPWATAAGADVPPTQNLLVPSDMGLAGLGRPARFRGLAGASSDTIFGLGWANMGFNAAVQSANPSVGLLQQTLT